MAAMSDMRCLIADLPYRIVTRAQPISDDERCPHIATQGLPLQDACDVGGQRVQDIRPSFRGRRMGYQATTLVRASIRYVKCRAAKAAL